MEYNQPSEIVKDVSFGDIANKKVVNLANLNFSKEKNKKYREIP